MRPVFLTAALLAALAAAFPVTAAERSQPGLATPDASHIRLAHAWRGHGMRQGPRRPAPLITLALRHREELQLSADQVERLEQLRTDFMRRAIRQRASIQVAEVDLAALRRAGQVDLAQVEAKLREIERLRADLRLARIRAIEQGRTQLSPEQRAKLRRVVEERWRRRPHPGRSEDSPRRGQHGSSS